MVWRPLAWLCLLLALAGPLVSEARVAYGLALSAAEIGRSVIESTQEEADEDYDGQDAVTVIAKAPVGLDSLLTPPAAFDLAASPPSFDLCPPETRLVPPRHGRWSWPPPTAWQRHALLQVFLF